jgi:hypothetical protein
VGAKLSVEPYVELEAKRASSHDKWTLDAQAGVSVSAATDIEIFGRQVRKAKEYALFDVALTKPGDEMGSAPRIAGPAVPPKTGRAAKVEGRERAERRPGRRQRARRRRREGLDAPRDARRVRAQEEALTGESPGPGMLGRASCATCATPRLG